MAIKVNEQLSLNENELHFEFINASGPGGQNINKVATAVKLYFDLNKTRSLSPEVISRLKKIARGKVNRNGELVIDARRFRFQQQNRQDAIARLVKLIRRALIKEKERIPSCPKRSAIERRIKQKKLHAQQKKLRSVKNCLD